MMWVLAMVPVVCLVSLRGIGWLTGGTALIVALACPQAMATIGLMTLAGGVVSLMMLAAYRSQ
jgi:hypothetical protein